MADIIDVDFKKRKRIFTFEEHPLIKRRKKHINKFEQILLKALKTLPDCTSNKAKQMLITRAIAGIVNDLRFELNFIDEEEFDK